jgi:putative aldouronate transport system permease protein
MGATQMVVKPAAKMISHERGHMLALVFRAMTVAVVMFAFIPTVNPIRFSALISGNVSLFTCVISRGAIVTPFTRALMRGWINAGLLNQVYIYALVMMLAVAAMATGGCMSLGNGPLRRLGCRVALVSAGVGLVALLASRITAAMFASLEEASRIEPLTPMGTWVFAGVFAGLIVVSVWMLRMDRRRNADRAYALEPYAMPAKYSLFLMALPFAALIVVFSYLPLLGWRYAFYDYKPGFALTADRFVGFKWFAYLFQNAATKADIARVMRNTLAMSGIGIADVVDTDGLRDIPDRDERCRTAKTSARNHDDTELHQLGTSVRGCVRVVFNRRIRELDADITRRHQRG